MDRAGGGRMYGSWPWHALIRTAAASALWVFLPALRLAVLPPAIGAIYLATVVGLTMEASGARGARVAYTAANSGSHPSRYL